MRLDMLEIFNDTIYLLLPGCNHPDQSCCLRSVSTRAQSGTTEVWQWNDGSGRYATLTFTDGYLVSKSQIGLQSDF